MRAALIYAFIAAAMAACFSPTYREGIECAPQSRECPPGMLCDPRDGRCYRDVPASQCLRDEDCASGRCDQAAGVCLPAGCGDGVVQEGEACDDSGASASCDPDCTPVSCGDGVVNEAAGEVCDTGPDACCAADCQAIAPASNECRAAVGPCDVVEVCDGLSPVCPPNQHVGAGTECRPGNGMCDPAERCDGASPECPEDTRLADGSECSDCEIGICDTCTAGVCVDGIARSCKEYLDARPDLPSGIYTIDPDGFGGIERFEVECDMVMDGGGWTLVGDYVSNKELFGFNPMQHQLQNDSGGTAESVPPRLDGTRHGHIAYDLIPFMTTRMQCRSSDSLPWFSAQTTLFTDWVPGDRGTYGSNHWAIVGGGNHGRSNHYICGYLLNTSGIYAGIAICNEPGAGGSFGNHVVSLSFNHTIDSYGGGLAIGCNGSGITYGKTGSWQGRVWLR